MYDWNTGPLAELFPFTVHVIGTTTSTVHLNTADCSVVILGEGVTENWRPVVIAGYTVKANDNEIYNNTLTNSHLCHC